MAWSEQWQHRVDALELNDLASGLVCEVPEVDNLFESQSVMVPIAGNYPVMHRQQPLSGRFTFLIHALKEDEPDWQDKLDAIRAVMGPGEHAYTYQVRGMAAPATVAVWFESLMVDEFKVGRCTAYAVAPDPRRT